MPDTTVEEVSRDTELETLQNELSEAKYGMAMLEESLADVMLALDDVGYRTIGDEYAEAEISLDTVRNSAKSTRSLLVLNPIAKRGVAVRTAYIWGGGVEFKGLDAKGAFYKRSTNQKYLLTPQAWGEMEACLATDGNFFLLVDKGAVRTANADKAKVSRIPMNQIKGTVSDPDNAEDIWFYKREWNTVINSAAQDATTTKENIAYYPAIDYDESNGRPRQIRGEKVIWNAAIAHNAVNKQTGWRWGVGDLTAVIFWLGAHKKFLEMSAQLVQAYSRFAFKATQPTRAGINATAAKVAAQPAVNPYTGQPSDVGGTAVLSGGANLQAIGRTGGSVDFKAGTPLAGYVAAGLEIPLTELLSDATDANRSSAETLNNATNKAMVARQEQHKRFFEAIFAYLGIEGVTVNFPPIESEPIWRLIQALAGAIPLNMLSAKEMRALIVKAFDLAGASDTPPTEEELGLLLASNTTAGKEAAALAKTQAENPAPAPGQPAPTKPKSAMPSYGDNSARTQQGNNNLNKHNKA